MTRSQMESPDVTPQKHRELSHELHRLLFLLHITHAHDVEKSARLSAQHAFSRLYHLTSDHRDAIRTELATFVANLYRTKQCDLSRGKAVEAMMSNIVLLEEAITPYIQDNMEALELLFAFSQSMFGIATKERITRKHIFLVGCGIVVGTGIMLVMLLLLNKIIQTQEDFDQTHKTFLGKMNHHFQRFTDKYTSLEKPTLLQRAVIKMFGSKRVGNLPPTPGATGTNTQ